MPEASKETQEIREYLKEFADEHKTRIDLFKFVAQKYNKTANQIENIWYGIGRMQRRKNHMTAVKEVSKELKGLDGFRSIHSKSEIRKTKGSKMREKVQELIDGDLKKTGWMYDKDVRERLGFSAGDHSLIRNDFEHLIIYNVPDANNRRSTVWGHPDIINSMREAINE